MKMLTQAIIKKLPALGSQDSVEDPIVQVKFFHPTSSFTWFVIEGDQQGEDWMFFGKVYSHLCPQGELGYFRLSDLKSAKGQFNLTPERDMWFKPQALSKCNQTT